MKLHCKFEFQDGAGEVWEQLFNEGGTVPGTCTL